MFIPTRRYALHTGLRLALGLLLSCMTSLSHAGENLRVLMVLSDDNPIYQHFADIYRSKLPIPNQLTVVRGAEKFSVGEQHTDLIVTVGSKAALAVVDRSDLPLLLTMLPSNLYKDLLAEQAPTRSISALFVDQPWSRHIELLFAAQPETRRIGLIYTPSSGLDIDELRKLAARHDAKVIARPVSSPEQLYNALEYTLSNSEVLLAVPDREIYSSNNIRNILMTSYRHDIPLIGLSKSYVNAGALCAVFSSPDDLALQASTMTQYFSRNKKLPPAQFPIAYDVATNNEVARTLGIKLKSPEQLLMQLHRAEGGQ
jgi:putative ABC transport system substrate-binding protein